MELNINGRFDLVSVTTPKGNVLKPDASGKISIPMTELIGTTTYADDAAAAAGGIPVGGLYPVTTTGVVHMRLV